MKRVENRLQINSHVAIVFCISLFLTACFGDNKQPDPDLDKEAKELSECSQEHWNTLKKLKGSKEAIKELDDRVRDIRKLPDRGVSGDGVAVAAAAEIGKIELGHLIETEIEMAIALCGIGCNADDADDTFWNEIATAADINTSCGELTNTCNEEELDGVWVCSYAIPYPEGCIIYVRDHLKDQDPQGTCEFYEYAWSEDYYIFADCPEGRETSGSSSNPLPRAHPCEWDISG